ncbi:MAG: hypothetical protein ACRDBH_08900, partial [Bosea sp. (in: a-proteobacteria)]
YLRREFPDAIIEVAINGGIDQSFNLQTHIESCGIHIDDYIGIIDCEDEAISKVCLFLLENIERSNNLKRNGETHLSSRMKVIPEKTVVWLIACMLDAQSWYGNLELNRDLIVLIRHVIMPGVSELEEISLIREKRQQAAIIAGQMFARGQIPSYRNVASLLKVQPSTVKRWFQDTDEFQKQYLNYSKWFDGKGNILPLPLRKK